MLLIKTEYMAYAKRHTNKQSIMQADAKCNSLVSLALGHMIPLQPAKMS